METTIGKPTGLEGLATLVRVEKSLNVQEKKLDTDTRSGSTLLIKEEAAKLFATDDDDGSGDGDDHDDHSDRPT